MKTKLFAIATLFIVLAFNGFSQSYEGSRFGASAAPWAYEEGWQNFQDLGVHYMRMPIDLSKGVFVDNFFFNKYDSLVENGQTYGIYMYGIVNPRKSNGGRSCAPLKSLQSAHVLFITSRAESINVRYCSFVNPCHAG